MPRRKRPVLGVDYIVDPDGSAQFTRDYLIRRGDCCENNCRYCPFPSASKPPARATPTCGEHQVILQSAAAQQPILSGK